MRLISALCALIVMASCQQKETPPPSWPGQYTGWMTKGQFRDSIRIDLEMRDSVLFGSFSSLAQNAVMIPLQNLNTSRDSLYFELRSDRYQYQFESQWQEGALVGAMKVDTSTISFNLKPTEGAAIEKMGTDIGFISNDSLELQGTIFMPDQKPKAGIFFVASSGPAGRQGTLADALYLTGLGYAVFHYDKRGTGYSEGDWYTATMETLLQDDLNALDRFIQLSELPEGQIGLMGSSQGAAKIPELLSRRPDLGFGILVSCPGASLLESDLNFWKNRNRTRLGNNLGAAAAVQSAVFDYLAGKNNDRTSLEAQLQAASENEWFESIWVPNLDQWVSDPKMTYSPLPYLKEVAQPMLLLQGDADIVIPENSSAVLQQAFADGKGPAVEAVMLEDADHGMYHSGPSDFPYWRNKHQAYFTTLSNWLDGAPWSN